MTSQFIEQLNVHPLLCDGAMGTMIYTRGVDRDACLDALNLTDPALIAEIHRAYIDAGVNIIETNTFGANRFQLAKTGYSVADTNRAGVELARRVVDGSFRDVFIAGAVGPLGPRLAPLGRLKISEAQDAFREQISALVEAGVDAIILETFTDLYELREAVVAMRQISPDLPLIAQLVFTQEGRTPLGHTPSKVASQLANLPIDVVGLNCSTGPAAILRNLQNLVAAFPEGTRFSAQPNAGWPERSHGRVIYPAGPEYFSEYAQAFIDAGASIVGGCCGTTPDHIVQMRAVLDNPKPMSSRLTRSHDNSQPQTTPDSIEPTRMAQRMLLGEFVVSIEMRPPKGFAVDALLEGAATLRAAGANAINVADSPRARMRMSPWAMCHLIQSRLDMETVLHFPTRGRNILRVQGDLLAAHALDVRNIFVVMGDPTHIGDYPEAMNDYDVVPTGLIKLLHQGLNQGLDHGGEPLAQPTRFHIGCALNLTPKDMDREINLLRKKIDHGADFALTQPVYDAAEARAFIQRYEELHGPLKLPIMGGVLPLYNARHAEFLHNEVPGINIPDAIRQRMHDAGNNSRDVGVEMAQQLIIELRSFVQGIYLMPPFDRYDLAADVIDILREETLIA